MIDQAGATRLSRLGIGKHDDAHSNWDLTITDSDLQDVMKVCLDFSDSNTAFYTKYGITPSELAERFESDYNTAPKAGRTDKQKAILGVLAFVGLAVGESSRIAVDGRRSAGSIGTSESMRARLDGLFGSSEVRDLFRKVFQPGTEIGETKSAILGQPVDEELANAVDVWEHAFSWDTLTFFECGTTSMLFLGFTTGIAPTHIVLKVVHKLFQGLEAVRDATMEYSSRLVQAQKSCPSLFDVLPAAYCSWSSFILEEYLVGQTLGQWAHARSDREAALSASMTTENGSSSGLKRVRAKLRRLRSYRAAKAARKACIEDIRSIGLSLLESLAKLHDAKLVHGDLSPSNIIVQGRPGSYQIRLIDLGRNFLASERIGQVQSPDSYFVAPEVIVLPPHAVPISPSADLYSFGLLMCVIGVVEPGDLSSGRIPDALFELSPLLARLAIDLTDPQPDRRLGVVRFDYGEKSLGTVGDLQRYLGELTSSLLELEEYEASAAGPRQIGGMIVTFNIKPILLLFPLAYRLKKSGFRSGELFVLQFFQLLAWLSLFLSVGVVSLALAYDIGSGYSSWRFLTNGVKGVLSGFGFPGGIRAERDQAKIAGVSFAVAAFQYYRIVFGEVSFWRSTGKVRKIVTEVSTRLMTVIVLPFIVIANLARPSLWIWFAGIGMGFVCMNNVLALSMQRHVAAEAQTFLNPNRLAIEPDPRLRSEEGRATSRQLEGWVPAMALFSVLVLALALAQSLGDARDLWVYALTITIVNVVYFAWAQATREGRRIRVSLARTSAYGERTRFAMGSVA